MKWSLFANMEFQKKHTRSEWTALVKRELTLATGERLFTDCFYGVPVHWLEKDGFESYLAECPTLLKSPHWRLAKRNERLPLSKENCIPVLRQKYTNEVRNDVRSLVDKLSDLNAVCSQLTNQGTPCPSGNWTPLVLREYCRTNRIKRETAVWQL